MSFGCGCQCRDSVSRSLEASVPGTSGLEGQGMFLIGLRFRQHAQSRLVRSTPVALNSNYSKAASWTSSCASVQSPSAGLEGVHPISQTRFRRPGYGQLLVALCLQFGPCVFHFLLLCRRVLQYALARPVFEARVLCDVRAPVLSPCENSTACIDSMLVSTSRQQRCMYTACIHIEMHTQARKRQFMMSLVSDDFVNNACGIDIS